MEKIKQYAYVTIRVLRLIAAIILFIAISSLSNLTAYYIAQRMTTEVSEDVIRVLHIVIALFAYHSFFRAFMITDKAARKRYYNSETNAIKYLFGCAEFKISLLIFIVEKKSLS